MEWVQGGDHDALGAGLIVKRRQRLQITLASTNEGCQRDTQPKAVWCWSGGVEITTTSKASRSAAASCCARRCRPAPRPHAVRPKSKPAMSCTPSWRRQRTRRRPMEPSPITSAFTAAPLEILHHGFHAEEIEQVVDP
jgi:hypothetical protein